jgi:hypothetical protein
MIKDQLAKLYARQVAQIYPTMKMDRVYEAATAFADLTERLNQKDEVNSDVPATKLYVMMTSHFATLGITDGAEIDQQFDLLDQAAKAVYEQVNAANNLTLQ